MNITTISFDGDATLWDFERVMRHSLKYALEELRKHAPGDAAAQLTIEKMVDIRNIVSEELRGRITNLEEIRLRAFIRTVKHVGVKNDELAHHLNSIYLKHRFEDIELYPDVIPTLNFLAPHFSLGLLSNGNSYPERCGLENRFTFVVFSQDVGFEKPDGRIFDVALKQANCSSNQLLHVGDSLQSDVAGAQNTGIRSVWLNRDNVPNDTEIEPDFEITSLDELPALCGIY